MSDSVKKIVVTGGLAVWTPPPTEGEGTRRARQAPTTRRQRQRQPKFAVSRQDGGDNGKEGNAIAPTENTAAPKQPNTTASNKVIRYVVTPEPAPAPFKNIPVAMQQNENNSKKITIKTAEQPAATAASPQPAVAGGGVTTKVVIGEKKPRHVKVILTKKRTRTPDAAPKVAEKAHKVKLKTGRLRKVMRRAQIIRAKAAELPLERVRAELVSKGVIKATSKAPEAMLRQMYADTKILSAKTL